MTYPNRTLSSLRDTTCAALMDISWWFNLLVYTNGAFTLEGIFLRQYQYKLTVLDGIYSTSKIATRRHSKYYIKCFTRRVCAFRTYARGIWQIGNIRCSDKSSPRTHTNPGWYIYIYGQTIFLECVCNLKRNAKSFGLPRIPRCGLFNTNSIRARCMQIYLTLP